MSNDERLRLLVIQQPEYESGHATGVSHGVTAIFSKWPSYIASAIWCVIFIVSLVTLLTLLIFMGLLREGKIYEQNVFIPAEEARYIVSYKIQSEFCNQMLTQHHKKRQEIPEHDLEVFDSGNNIFYLALSPLDKFAACSVESVVRLCPEKNIFLMFLKKVGNTQFENALMKEYHNFNLLNINGKKILRGSPFEGKWNADDRSLFEVALLTVWQFGGTVMSDKLLMLDRKLYDSHNKDCLIDPQLIYCPMQCASFIYFMIGETLKAQRNSSIENIFDKSISSFCGSEHFIKTGCKGVAQIDETDMCSEPDGHCMFVRSQQWLKTSEPSNGTLWKTFVDFCPVVNKQNIIEEHKIQKEKYKTTAKVTSTTLDHNKQTKSSETENVDTTETAVKNLIETFDENTQTTSELITEEDPSKFPITCR